ncbi:MAG TPA: ornithine cyclodeaminase family protein [Alphaproteobacteria bacterium]|jgi:ornithine cyclodeaminase/alanine dehydrogenase-like protein (mu-crystallin family)
MTIFINDDHVRALHDSGAVTMADYVDAVEAAYRDQGTGDFQILPRQNFWMERPGEKRPGSLKLGGGLLKKVGVMGCSMYSTGFGGGMNLWVTVYSAVNGDVEAILHSGQIGPRKTGATSAVATKYMARPDAAVAALIGTGDQARTQLMGLMAVRALRELRVYSRDKEKRDAFAAWARASFPALYVVSAASGEAAAKGADIVTTVTNSKTPVLDAAWIDEGAHCNFIGAHYPEQREVDEAVLKRGKIVVDDLDQAFHEKGELIIPLKAGAIARDVVLGDIGSVIAGKLTPRASDKDITIFLSGGTSLEYMSACAMLARKAKAAGLGQTLDGGN